MNEHTPPRRVFKYRAFSGRVLDMLVADQLYFSDPADFNDPLDSRPNVEGDISADELERILSHLVEQRTNAEMTTAAKSLKYRGPRTIEHIARHSRKRADRLLSEIRYNAGDPTFEMADPELFLLTQYLEEELLRRYDRGIVSFGARATCPLMWSHYGDQHRGICAGYSVPKDSADRLKKIDYGGSRNVKASDVAIMDHDPAARRRVDDAVLLRKASSWRYEQEWRLIGNRGLQDCPLELEEVVFGMRCGSALKYTIFRALDDRQRPIQFYEMREQRGTFKLRKCRMDVDELEAHFPRRARSYIEAFDDLDVEEAPRDGSE
ncbi:DUF2971 domain-containing protein [Roseovarius sp. SCSIO 43702]|uniref:DUF2971 domain-containing protein n=1 Tax=Roseovarius sp. SCSIO 43702 TaxID=2823043 RepID=UPI001C73069E|nr:DUF2971 domain-containing protein [Roseovarius sp. SCSIO 43702]QYX56532.1 DUF2971 domain-containing protein [Roseovarius sp. SCSIO 43702]